MTGTHESRGMGSLFAALLYLWLLVRDAVLQKTAETLSFVLIILLSWY
jgi:hypothetical protein